LAKALEAFFKGEQETISLPRKSAGPVALVALLPLLMPVLAIAWGYSMSGFVGGLIWGLFALFLAGVCCLIVFRTSWTAASRGGTAGAAVLVGYMILGCGLLIDRASSDSVPSSAWKSFTPQEGGYTVLLPGTPRPGLFSDNNFKGGGLRTWQGQVEQAGL